MNLPRETMRDFPWLSMTCVIFNRKFNLTSSKFSAPRFMAGEMTLAYPGEKYGTICLIPPGREGMILRNPPVMERGRIPMVHRFSTDDRVADMPVNIRGRL